MVGWLIEQYNTIKKVTVVEREAFYCFFAKVSLGSVPKMSAESCREIKASEQGTVDNSINAKNERWNWFY